MKGLIAQIVAILIVFAIQLSGFEFSDTTKKFSRPVCMNTCFRWCENITTEASLLYWQLGGDDFDYAIEKSIKTRATPFPAQSDEKVHDLSFDLDPGVRLGVWFTDPCLAYDVAFIWTHFDTRQRKTQEVKPVASGNLGNVFSVPFFNGFAGSAGTSPGTMIEISGHEKFRLNWYDLECGQWCHCNSFSFKFRPHIGLRIADIDDKMDVETHFKGGLFFFNDDNGVTHAIIENKGSCRNRFQGVGVRGGINAECHLCDAVSLIGRFAGAVIWGNTNYRYRYAEVDERATEVETLSGLSGTIRENNHQCRSTIDLCLGLAYSTCMCFFPVTFEVSWEQHYLFSQHKYIVDNRFADTTAGEGNAGATSSWRKNGNACLNGMTCSAVICF